MKYRAYPAYKLSGVEWLGKVPEHWGIKRLRFNVTLNPSKSEVAKLSKDQLVSFVPMESISENGKINLSLMREIESVYQGFTYFKDGDVLVAKITPCFETEIEIATFLDRETQKFYNLISKAQKAITLLKEHRTALISAAAAGKIDVRPPASHPVGDQRSSKPSIRGGL